MTGMQETFSDGIIIIRPIKQGSEFYRNSVDPGLLERHLLRWATKLRKDIEAVMRAIQVLNGSTLMYETALMS